LWRWWGPGRLYADLAQGVEDMPVIRVVVGLNWTMVETPTGIGLAQTPERGTPGCAATSQAGKRTEAGLRDLAGLVHSDNPFDKALGMAACNAWYNRFDMRAEGGNGLESFGTKGAGTVVIGAFPGIAERLPGARIIDRKPGPGQYPEQAAEGLLPGAEAVIMTASTARVALVGPGAPLTARLFNYGIEVSSGLIAEDRDGLARTVAEGGGAKDLKRHCRQATIRKPATP
ncbi:MAG: hypothetical protein HY055_01970, partial [Magnetospirillum sp.]|nr:hypothetical protein [Magnetospirillum sp.]